MQIVIGEARYRIRTEGRLDRWVAQAELESTGERFGPEITADTAQAAIDQAAAWLGWQAEHGRALDVLQQAERAYHRAVAGHAFAGSEQPAAGEVQRGLLEHVDTARRALDFVRARRPT
jgi:hypothetical protein